MKVITRVVVDIETGHVEYQEAYEYHGSVAYCGGGGGGGDGDGGGLSAGDSSIGDLGAALGPGGPGFGLGFGTGEGVSGDGPGGFWGSLTSTQQSLAEFTGTSLMTGNIPGAMLGLVGLAVSGAGSGEVGDVAGGMGGNAGVGAGDGNILMAAPSPPINTITEQPTPEPEPPTVSPPPPTRRRKGRTENLLTGPLGLVDNPPIEIKSLMTRNTRSTLGF